MQLYRVNEIFYSVQGEGANAGTPAVFVRFSGCNLHCPFCDTQHQAYTELSESEIVASVAKYPAQLVVLTGGEPSLFVTDSLISALKKQSRIIAVETNGTHSLPQGVDFVTLSPKCDYVPHSELALHRCDELKVVYDGTADPSRYSQIQATYRFLQPCDVGDEAQNKKIVELTFQYCLQHPEWRISLQLQKILNIR